MNASVLDRPLHATPTLEPTKTRLSFQDAVQAVADNSRLKAMLNGTEEPHNWHEAVNADLATGNNLLVHLAEDLTRITGQTVSIDAAHTLFSEVHKAVCADYPDVMSRITAIHTSFVAALRVMIWHVRSRITANRLRNSTERVERQISGRQTNVYHETKSSFFPMTEIVTRGDTAVVSFCQPTDHGEKLYDIKLASFAFICPDDFPRSIPGSAKKKLDILRTTHFNYHPKILDGVLIEKVEIQTTKKEFVYSYDPDPALVIHLGLFFPPFAVDYWDDKIVKAEPPSVPAVNGYALFYLALLMQLLHIPLWMACLNGPVAGLLLAVVGSCLLVLTFIGGFIRGCQYENAVIRRNEWFGNHLIGRHNLTL